MFLDTLIRLTALQVYRLSKIVILVQISLNDSVFNESQRYSRGIVEFFFFSYTEIILHHALLQVRCSKQIGMRECVKVDRYLYYSESLADSLQKCFIQHDNIIIIYINLHSCDILS